MLYDLTELCCQNLPASKPRYLMGVGTPANLLACILRGVDMFDCVLPSRNARHGMVYTWQGIRNLKNAKYARNFEPLDTDAHCPYDTQYSHAYLRHLFQADESLAAHIATVHNLSFYLRLVTEARRRILDGSFAAWATATIPQLEQRI
jgi:queuine tRNA-ribosyltransferase